jgi:hypothetical protein
MLDWLYWEVDGKRTNSKGQALLWANGDISKIKFYFCDDEWKDENFLNDPAESFENLAMERCNQLRAKYNWLCLWLSSGYDSVTVLEYFKLSKNKLDEIIVYRRNTINDNEFVTALKMAENYKKYYNSRVRITYLPIDYNHMDKLYNKLKGDWILAPGLHLRFTKTAPVWQVTHHSDVLRTIKEGVTRGDITGWEKPKLWLENNKWYSILADASSYDAGCSERLIGFFTHRDAFKLYLKQHYLLIKWFESFKNLNEKMIHEMLHKVQGEQRLYYYESNIACGRIPVTNEYSMHAAGKKLFLQKIDSPDSVPYLKHFTGTKSIDYFMQGIHSIREKYPQWNPYDDFDQHSLVFSKKRFLRDRIVHEN